MRRTGTSRIGCGSCDYADIVVVDVTGQAAWASTPARVDAWWEEHGRRLIGRWSSALRQGATESGVSVAKVALGKILTQPEIVEVFRSEVWRRTKTFIAMGDANSALQEIQNAGRVGELILRQKLQMHELKGMTTTGVSAERVEIMVQLDEFIKLEDAEIESELRSTFVNRIVFPVGFAILLACNMTREEKKLSTFE